MRKVFFRLGISMTICGILATIAVNTAMKDWLIIGYGIRAYTRVRRVGNVIILVGILFLFCYGVFVVKWLREQQEQEKEARHQEQVRSQVLSEYAEDSLNPEAMRRRLVLLGDERPEFTELAVNCVEQMDLLKSLRNNQQTLLSINDATYLSETICVIDNVERCICGNFRNIINLCIAAGSVATLDQVEVEKNLNSNQEILDKLQKMVEASANWINQYNSDNSADGGKSEVERWIAVIQNALREG